MERGRGRSKRRCEKNREGGKRLSGGGAKLIAIHMNQGTVCGH